MAVAAACAHPALAADHHRDRLVQHLDFQHRFFLGLDQGAARVGELFGIRFDFLDHQPAQRRRVAQNVFQLAFFITQGFQFLLDLDGFEPGQLAQADFQDVLGLPIAQVEPVDQRGLRLVRLADDGNHLVDVEQDDLPPLKDMDARQHLVEPVLRALFNRRLAKGDPLVEHLAQ